MRACAAIPAGSLADKGLSASTWQGIREATRQFGLEASLVEVTAQGDYASAINEFVDQHCSIIVTIGSATFAAAADATLAAANANPGVPFSIVGDSFAPGDVTNGNVLGQVFTSDEAAFLAGYLAAGMTKTGTVATYGGEAIAPVTDLMAAFYRGAQRYNEDNEEKVRVLGWNPDARVKGLFTGNFERIGDGRSFAQALAAQGADIIMPVAGPAGLGTSAVAAELGPDALKVIGVDSDHYVSDEANRQVYLTSVLRNADVTTFNAIESVVEGTFEGGVATGTLANGGVGLAPFHDFDAIVPQDLKDQLAAISAGIIDGSISVRGA